MCNQFTLHHEFRIDTRRTTFEQIQTFFSVDPMDKEHKDTDVIDLDAPRLASYKQKNVEETSKHGVQGRYTACSTERIEILSNKM